MEPGTPTFRDYDSTERDCVVELYRKNHTQQTWDYVGAKQKEYAQLNKKRMGVWEAIALLDSIVDDSDPDTELSQLEHALQSAEAARRDNQPDWFILTALIHDLGKVLCTFGEPQWAVVGDTFPLGLPFSEKVVHHGLFADNPDGRDARFATPLGVYAPGCGLERVRMSWGHDEYLYYVLRDHLPPEALSIVRYHSFYALHTDGAYTELLDATDQRRLEWVKRFNQYDLYSKADAAPDVQALRPYYAELVAKYLPDQLSW